MLARLRGPVLERLRFPLGDLAKADARAMARAAGLPAADAVESQEVCFVGAGGYAPFLERAAGMAPRPGPILDRRRPAGRDARRLLALHRRPAPGAGRRARRAPLRPRPPTPRPTP